jgi:hypothetical protein
MWGTSVKNLVLFIIIFLQYYIMMHREAFRRKRGESQQSQESGDKTADEAIKNQRCAVPAEIFNDVAVLASASKKTNCEVQIEAIKYYANRQKLLSDCKTGEATGEVCKYSDTG